MKLIFFYMLFIILHYFFQYGFVRYFDFYKVVFLLLQSVHIV